MKPQFQDVDGVRYVKVRVPVIVDAEGNWSATSYSDRNGKEAANEVAGVADGMGYDHVRRIYWLYALVPVPDADTYAVIGCRPERDND